MTVFLEIPLHWLDLLLIIFVLWTGVEGWLRGWKSTAWRLVMLGAAIPVAVFWQKELQALPAFRGPLKETLQTMAATRLVLPVSVSPGDHFSSWFTAMREWLSLNPEPVAVTLSPPTGYLVGALFNTVAFGLALLIWGGILYLTGALCLDRKHAPGATVSRLAGFMAGAVRGIAVAVLVIGLAIPILLLAPAVWEWGMLDRTFFLRLCMRLFNLTGVWWD